VLAFLLCCEALADCDVFDNDESLQLLQQRGAYVQAQNATGSHHLSLALALTEALSRADAQLAVGAYAYAPALLALGLPLLLGCGALQVVAFGAFWMLLRPCASMLQVSWWYLDLGQPQARSLSGMVPEAMCLAAHFYWAWGLFELAVRRRSLLCRLSAVLLLGLALLPVPLAQVHIGNLSRWQASCCAVLAQFLGVSFFFALRTAPCWRLIKALPSSKAGAYQLHDNLSSFWGGCSWPQSRRWDAKAKDVVQEDNDEDAESEDDFQLCPQAEKSAQ